jgi:hypothetical protein
MKQYVPTTLEAFLTESKLILLKRKYGQNESIVVGSNAPIRNKVLSYVAENNKVSYGQIKRFIAKLNEESKNPIAAANMWLNRNAKFFITENKAGIYYFKLSNIGKRLTNSLFETEELRQKLDDEKPMMKPLPKAPIFPDHDDLEDNEVETPQASSIEDDIKDMENDKEDYKEFPLPAGAKLLIPEEGDEDNEEDEMLELPERPGLNLGRIRPNLEDDLDSEDDDNEFEGKYDFLDRRKGRPGIYDEMSEVEEPEESEKDIKESLDDASKTRIKRIIENIKAKANKETKLNEAEEEKEEASKEDDELTFDDLDLGNSESDNEVKDDSAEKTNVEGKEDTEGIEGKEGKEGKEEKVEITEFVITVENVDSAITELEDLGVTAEKVIDEEGKEIEDQIKVSAENWEALKGWLEEKGVDVEEMFGGEIEVEGDETEETKKLEGDEEIKEPEEDIEDSSELDNLEEPIEEEPNKE